MTQHDTCIYVVNSTKMRFKLDSGADVSIVARNNYEKRNPRPALIPADLKLSGVSVQIEVSGYFDADIRSSNQATRCTKIYVANHRTDNLLSRSVSVQLKLIQRLDNVSVFDGLGMMKCKPVNAMLRNDAKPYSLHTPRRISEPLAPKVEEEIQSIERRSYCSC